MPAKTKALHAFAVLTLAIIGRPASAQEVRPDTVARRIGAQRILDADGIRLDGALDEPAWRDADRISGFRQREPLDGEPATEDTEVRVLYDGEYLYIGVRAFDSQPDRIIARQLERDSRLGLARFGPSGGDDAIEIILDTFHDRRNAYYFATNPQGVLTDGLITDESERVDLNWDAVWDVRARTTAEGWSAEFQIPLRSIRFPARDGEQTWGFNVQRAIRRKNEQSLWTSWSRDNEGLTRVSRAGELTGLQSLPGGLDLYVKPYVLGEAGRDYVEQPDGDVAWDGAIGLDAKLGLSSGLVVDLTINTDFAQVEADDEQVDLTRFNLFFPEKREFFLEKRDFFNFGSFANRPFFSRSIGIQSFDEPRPGAVVPIDYGARLTGKVGRTDLGLLHMETSESNGLPSRSFQVARFSRDVGTRSRLGVIGTRRGSKEMDGLDEPTNYSGGFDGDFGLTDEIDFRIFGAASDESGDGPDRATWGAGLTVTYPDWNAVLVQEAIGTDYDPQAGFVQRRGVNQTIVGLGHTSQPNWSMSLPGPDLSVRQFENHAQVQWIDRRHGERETRFVHVHPMFVGAGQSEMGIIYENSFERLLGPFPLGGDVVFPAGGYDFDRWGANLGSDPSRTFSASLVAFDGGFFDADQQSLTLATSFLLPPHVTTAVEFERERIERTGTDDVVQEFTSNLLRLRLELDVSNSLTFNLFTQWNETENLLLSQIRGHYIFGDESDVYVVIADDRADGSGHFNPRRGEWTLKLNYARRL